MAIAALNKAILLVAVASGFRQRKRERHGEASSQQVVAKDQAPSFVQSDCGGSSRGKVRLLSYAAPKVSDPILSFGGGCIPGYRVEVENWGTLVNTKDIVTWLLVFLQHPFMQALRLGQSNRTSLHTCDWKRSGIVQTSIPLHSLDGYVSRSMAYGGEVAVVADVGLRYSYNPKPANEIRAKGWGLVATADIKGELSHLIQNPTTLECVLTFEGSDRWQDWGYNVNVFRKTWCGYNGVHGGFKDSLVEMISSAAWQTKVRPHLGFCSALKVTGHSLGGAMATLWAACADAVGDVSKNSADYKLLNFTWKTPKKMAYL